jgi:DNA-binding NarL/FixJ family response regulator
MKRPRVLLADAYRLLREAFARLLEPSCDVVGTVADGRALLAAAPRLRPDIVVLDIAMPRLNGLDATRKLKRVMPEVKVVFLAVSEDCDLVREAFRAGASAYLVKMQLGALAFLSVRAHSQHPEPGRKGIMSRGTVGESRLFVTVVCTDCW